MSLSLPASSTLILDRSSRISGWALYAASIALAVWVVIEWMRPAPVVAPVMQTGSSVSFKMDQAPEARLLGIETTGGLTPPSVKLLGVFAGSSGSGAVVMSIEGKPAESIAVGQEVANGWLLDRVEPQAAVISRRGQTHRVQLPVQPSESPFMKRVQ